MIELFCFLLIGVLFITRTLAYMCFYNVLVGLCFLFRSLHGSLPVTQQMTEMSISSEDKPEALDPGKNGESTPPLCDPLRLGVSLVFGAAPQPVDPTAGFYLTAFKTQRVAKNRPVFKNTS